MAHTPTLCRYVGGKRKLARSFAYIEAIDVIYSVSKSSRKRELLIAPRHRNRTTLAMAA